MDIEITLSPNYFIVGYTWFKKDEVFDCAARRCAIRQNGCMSRVGFERQAFGNVKIPRAHPCGRICAVFNPYRVAVLRYRDCCADC